MRNKILVAILVVLVTILIICLSYRSAIIEKLYRDNLEKSYEYICGTVTGFSEDIVHIKLDKEYVGIFEAQDENTDMLYVVFDNITLDEGDYVKLYYTQKDVDATAEHDTLLKNPLVEVIKKTRVFNQDLTTPVSNSKAPAGQLIFNSVSIKSDEKALLKRFTQNNDFYVKKIVSYDDYLTYKENYTEIRDLTEKDFTNYYLVLVLSTNSQNVYTFNKTEQNENKLNIILKESKSLNDTNPLYTGIYVVIPNYLDLPEESFNIISSSDIYKY